MTETEKLKQQLQVRQVAFSASIKSVESQTIGPFDSHTILIYNNVFTNVGNAYSPHTGIFAAPVRGAYHFEFHVAGPGNSSHGLCTVLVRNGMHVVTAWDQKESTFGSSSNGVTLILEAGDQVFMRLWSQYKIYDDQHHYSTFSGHMLFAM
ncbi:complement C1q-like protein 2 [Astatotilapia calliptera]|uniref:C1q domain-containing protein n=1 Tax=Astatotilapia calliptera TaxID=8154 RepID=A0A3P8RAJ9_ASTCA|nr:complement C1q-like protein 2 [Astatotilapia calliptera]